jgi:hypothetical protein
MTGFLRRPGGERHDLFDGLRLGRSPAADVELADPSVSRDHAQVSGRPGRWLLSDLHSSNGTWVNDRRLAPGGGHPLHHGDRVRCGRVVLDMVLDVPEGPDPTTGLEMRPDRAPRHFSPYQREVLRLLCSTQEPQEPLSNAEIARALGTPAAIDAVKTALSRVYARAGLTGVPAAGKRRELRRRATEQGWIP